LWIGPMCIWRFWLSVSSATEFQSIDLNSWDTLYKNSPGPIF
jgi:hypothetical protein